MIEKLIVLEDVDPVVFYGVGNANMSLMKSLYPKLRIVARGDVVKVLGEEEQAAAFEKKIKEIMRFCAERNALQEEDILEIVNGHAPGKEPQKDIIAYTMGGKPIQPRSANQAAIVESFRKNDLTFAVGPAGTGKTYLSIALAVQALKNKEVRRIILSRPAVEAGEKLGFLPGDMRDKIDPYLQPLYDALQDMMPQGKLQEYMESGVIQIAPLAFMRGRTLSEAVVILDEAQNTTKEQIKMFMTRMGMNTKMIITGDITQIDLPQHQKSGLIDALGILHNVKGIGIAYLDRKDIVRHKLVERIVQAYESAAQEGAERTQ